MKLVVTHALRLVRRDLERLTDVHHAQFVLAIAPGKPDVAESLIEEASDQNDEDARGLVYLRMSDAADPKRAFEGWLLDDARHPAKRASPDGGAFFIADTTTLTGVQMSQTMMHAEGGELRDAIAAIVKKLDVVVRGPALKANPPFLHAKAPPPKQTMDPGTATLRVVRARRYTESSMRAAPQETRFQFLHAVRPLFATPTPEGMEGFFAIGILYPMIDPGPETGNPKLMGGSRRGLVHVRFAVAGETTELEGWFWLGIHEAGGFWPCTSTQGTVTEGRIMLADTITPTGVEVAKGKVRVSARKALPSAKAIAKGLQKLGLTFDDVEVVPTPNAGQKGYFGTKIHAREIVALRDYEAMQAAYKTKKKAKK